MFIVIASLCASLEAPSCLPMIWAKEAYSTVEECEKGKEEALANLPPQVVVAFARCVEVPELPGTSL